MGVLANHSDGGATRGGAKDASRITISGEPVIDVVHSGHNVFQREKTTRARPELAVEARARVFFAVICHSHGSLATTSTLAASARVNRSTVTSDRVETHIGFARDLVDRFRKSDLHTCSPGTTRARTSGTTGAVSTTMEHLSGSWDGVGGIAGTTSEFVVPVESTVRCVSSDNLETSSIVSLCSDLAFDRGVVGLSHRVRSLLPAFPSV